MEITDDNIDAIKSGITVKGQGFTLSKVSVTGQNGLTQSDNLIAGSYTFSNSGFNDWQDVTLPGKDIIKIGGSIWFGVSLFPSENLEEGRKPAIQVETEDWKDKKLVNYTELADNATYYKLDITSDNIDDLIGKTIHVKGYGYTLTAVRVLTPDDSGSDGGKYVQQIDVTVPSDNTIKGGDEDWSKEIPITFTDDQKKQIVEGAALKFSGSILDEKGWGNIQININQPTFGTLSYQGNNNCVNFTSGTYTLLLTGDIVTNYNKSEGNDASMSDVINAIRDNGIVIKGENIKVTNIQIITADRPVVANLTIKHWGRKFKSDGTWTDGTTYDEPMGQQGPEYKHEGSGKWSDRTIGDDVTDLPASVNASNWQGNMIDTVRIITDNAYTMDVEDGNPNMGDQDMIVGLYARVLDLREAKCKEAADAGCYVSSPEISIYKKGRVSYSLLMNVIYNSHPRLTEVFLPFDLESVGFEAFSNCPDLTTVHMGRGLKVIGNNAFGDCPNLTTIVVYDEPTYQLPQNLQFIGNRAFQNDVKLTFANNGPDELKRTDGKYAFGLSYNKNKVSSSIEEIGDDAFLNCVSLSPEIIIPGSIKRVGNRAFQIDNNHRGHINDNTYKEVTFYERLYDSEIGQYAFSQSGDDRYGSSDKVAPLSKVTFNKGDYDIRAAAFQNDVLLRELHLEKGAKIWSIGAHAFENCHSLSDEFTVGENTTSNVINDILAGLWVDNGVPPIGNHAFANCNGALYRTDGTQIGDVWNNWYKVTIPSSWSYLPASLFENDFNLTQIHVSNATAPTTANAFDETKEDTEKDDKFESVALVTLHRNNNSPTDYYFTYDDADEGKTFEYPFHGIVANRCQLIFDNWIDGSDYRNQPGFMNDILTKYLDDQWTESADGNWNVGNYYCVQQSNADVYLKKNFQTGDNWNTCSLPFDIDSKDKLTQALGDGAVAALYAENTEGANVWQVRGNTLHFVRLAWYWDDPNAEGNDNYQKLGWGKPFILKGVTANKQKKEFLVVKDFKGTGNRTVLSTDKQDVEGYLFKNVQINANESDNWSAPTILGVNNGTDYTLMGNYYKHSVDLTTSKPFWFIYNNKFYSTDLVAPGKPERTVNMNGFCFYIEKTSEDEKQAKSLNIGFDENETPTGIDNANIVVDPDPEGNAKVYNLQGQAVGKDYKGIVIINGRKVIRK